MRSSYAIFAAPHDGVGSEPEAQRKRMFMYQLLGNVRALARRAALWGCVAAAAMTETSQAQPIEDALEAIAREVRDGQSPSEAGSPAPVSERLAQALLDAGDRFMPDLAADQLSAGMPKRLSGGKVSGRLLQLADHRAKALGGLDAQAKSLGVPFHDGLADVRLVANAEQDVADLVRQVERHGGVIAATFENMVLASLPVDEIETIGTAKALYYMDAAAMFHPLRSVGYGDRVSEGLALVNAHTLQEAGVTGRGVKVGILDFGFQKYQALVATGEVPRAQAARAFNRAGRVEVSTPHGTGCAEIIADMAPDAELYVAAVDGTEGQIIAAGQWLASQGVDIVNFSGGGHFGPHNGSALLDRFVDHTVRENDLLWVNAAGNEGATHWTAMAVDRNRNGFVDNVDSRFPDLIAVAGQQLQITVVWDDWGSDPQRPSARQDIDAYLLLEQAGGLVPVAASREVQNGRGRPAEMVALRGIPRGQVLYLALHMKNVNRAVRVHVFVRGGDITPKVPGHSVAIPATARAALAVAAVDARNDRLEDFSSRGPTDDRRMKPEVSAPDNTTSMAYGRGRSAGRFPGTSAAAPHVAGFAALLKQLEPQASAANLYAAVQRHVVPKGRGAPNAEHGHGRIDAKDVNVGSTSNADEPSDGQAPDDSNDGQEADDFERTLLDIINQSG